jgi:hypothetical protein
MPADDLTVCVLLYGADDYCFRMAQRVLNQRFKTLGSVTRDVRFGLNAVGEATRNLLAQVVSDYFPEAVVIDCPENIHKYPMMRRLLYEKPLQSRLTMWFDDDSCIAENTDVAVWLTRIRQQMCAYTMLGSVHKERFVGNQAEWIKAQPWYNGKEPSAYTQFAAGGWWVTQTEALRIFNWPPAELKHRGGDIMLGELLRQHDLPLGHFRDGVWINANEHGIESQSTRRGVIEAPVGVDYEKVLCNFESVV